jgi:S-DNA-T family DNA segregation ATPase FtsK/SpoIIIE
MQISQIRRGVFDHQADRIEKILSSLAVPTRVQGGQVNHDRVRYHLAPVSNAQAHEVCAMSTKLAEAMGVYKVDISEEGEGLVLDLPVKDEADLGLLPLIMDTTNPLPMTSIVGITMHGKPLLLNFRRREAWHLGIFAPLNTGKSELLRTLIVSLALYNRPSQFQLLGIDFSGMELSVIDALPHALSEVASEREYAEEVLRWVVEEMEERKVNREVYPDIFLVIDDLDKVVEESSCIHGRLPLILHEGPQTGVHLLVASKRARPGSLIDHWQKSGVVTVRPAAGRKRKGDSGQFEFQMARQKVFAQVAWLPAKHLQQAVTMIQTGWRANKGAVDVKKLW